MRSIRSIGGVDVEVTSRSQVASRFYSSIQKREKFYLAFANTNLVTFANRSAALRAALWRFHIINDGVGMQIASLASHGKKFPENLNGTDLVPYLLGNSPVPTKVFLFGAVPESVKGAAAALEALPNVKVCGFRDGYSCWDKMPDLVNEINEADPDVVLVALGNPTQELWVAKYGWQLKAPAIMAVGALLDFMSGAQKRAPGLMRYARLEWLHRMVCDPKRLWRRYTVDIGYFFYYVLLRGSGCARAFDLLLDRVHFELELFRKAFESTRRRT